MSVCDRAVPGVNSAQGHQKMGEVHCEATEIMNAVGLRRFALLSQPLFSTGATERFAHWGNCALTSCLTKLALISVILSCRFSD